MKTCMPSSHQIEGLCRPWEKVSLLLEVRVIRLSLCKASCLPACRSATCTTCKHSISGKAKKFQNAKAMQLTSELSQLPSCLPSWKVGIKACMLKSCQRRTGFSGDSLKTDLYVKPAAFQLAKLRDRDEGLHAQLSTDSTSLNDSVDTDLCDKPAAFLLAKLRDRDDS